MQLLKEQKEYLEQEIESLRQRQEKIKKLHSEARINVGINQNYTHEANGFDEKLEISVLEKQIIDYENLLKNSTVVISYDNEKIDIGTTFVVKFDDCDETETYTLIEMNLGKKFTSNNGYITKNSLFGQEVQGLKEGNNFSYTVKDRYTVNGKIVEIIPKQSLADSEDYSKPVTTQSVVVKPMINTRIIKHCPYRAYIAYREKVKSLAKYNECMEKEVRKLNSITKEQVVYLKEKLEQLEREPKNRRIGSAKHIINRELKKEVITPQTSSYVDIGAPVILEVQNEDGILIEDLNVVGIHYWEMGMSKYISVRDYRGFALYKTQIGDTIHLKESTSEPEQIIKIKQFGFHKKDLLLPTSSNLDSYTFEEREESIFREKYIRKESPVMTESQKELLELEKSKLSPLVPKDNYANKLSLLTLMVDNKRIYVQTEEDVLKNGESVGIGSKVHYAFLKNDDLEEHQAEIIECAFTTELKQDYIETITPLGKALLGRKKDEMFKVETEMGTQTGIVLDVINKQVELNRILEKTGK